MSLYDNGLPFTDHLKDNLDDQTERIKNNKASLIIVSGGLGSGKTTLSVHMLNYFNKSYGLPPIDLKQNIKDLPQYAIGGDDFLNKKDICYENKIPVIIYDEAGDYSKRGSLSKFNSNLNRTFDLFRAFKLIVIMVLPNFNVIDNDLFDKEIPRLLLRTRRENNKDYSEIKGYGLFEMNLLRQELSNPNKKLYAYNNIYCNFDALFKDLDAEQSHDLDILTTKDKLKISKKLNLKRANLINKKEIAEKLNITVASLSNKLRNKKIQPKQMIENKAYYDKDVIGVLLSK
jgi:hypothetical protein